MDLSTSTIIWIAASTLFTLLLVSTMGLFSGNQMPVAGKTVLVTGASEGMGLAAAKQLAAKGANVILVSRSVPKLEIALAETQAAARNPSTQRFRYIAADVSKPDYATPVLEEATAWNNGRSPDIVWCIAGRASLDFFTQMEVQTLRDEMDVNFFGTVEMSHAILKKWLAVDAPVEKESRHLIMTTSTIVFYSIPGYAAYAPTKYAIRALGDTMSQEVMVYPQNVKIHVVCPGTILSPGFERENMLKPDVTKQMEEADPQQTPEEVAQKAIQGLEAGQYLIVVNWLGHLMRWGGLAGSLRNNWFLDTLGGLLTLVVWPFVHMDIHGKAKGWGKKHGHPSTFKKAVA